MTELWRIAPCWCHAGTVGGADGLPEEHRECAGVGQVWIRPNGAVAQYPGGPWLGNWGPDAYERASATALSNDGPTFAQGTIGPERDVAR